jgi:hypothetical protein
MNKLSRCGNFRAIEWYKKDTTKSRENIPLTRKSHIASDRMYLTGLQLKLPEPDTTLI